MDERFFIDKNGVLFKYEGYKPHVVIPNGVTEIGENVFQDHTWIVSVVLPDTVKIIGKGAFCNCPKMISVKMGKGVTRIRRSAFANCYGLTGTLTIPETVTDIESGAFSGCSGLTGTLIIPDGVTSIGVSAFSGCSGLTSVTIGNGITSIGWDTFWGCSGLTSLMIGSGVTEIREGAFFGCYRLIEIRNLSRLNICARSFDLGQVALHAKHVCSDGESYLHTTDDEYIFYEDGDEVYLVDYVGPGTELVLPDNYNGKNYAIYEDAFCGKLSLISVNIPNSVISIEACAFRDCTSLTSLTIGRGIIEISNSAVGNTKLTEVVFLGTKDEWDAIDKTTASFRSNHYEERGWNVDTDISVVHCKDGDIEVA